MAERGAVFGQVYGWERPNFFVPGGPAPQEERLSFRRPGGFEHAQEEARHVGEHVGLLDMTAFSKFSVQGPGAAAWLDSILSNKTPTRDGRMALSYLLTSRGGVRCEFTVFRVRENDYYLVSAGAFERHDGDVLGKLLPKDGSVTLRTITAEQGVLVLAGPKSRDVLQSLTDVSLANTDFPWLSGKRINVGHAEANALRVNFVGELGWELHHPIHMQNAIYDALMDAGEAHGIRRSASARWTRCGSRSPTG